MESLAKFTAEISFLSPERGGRRMPVHSGYRPRFYFGERQSDGDMQFESSSPVSPGQVVRAAVRLLNPDVLGQEVGEGAAFQIKEGDRLVASGVILAVLP